jgi:glycosyltransferase involved in cell wall biosynthesis
MRIAIAAPNRQLLGGAETYLRALLPALHGAGHDVALFYEVEAPDHGSRIDASILGVDAYGADPAAGEEVGHRLAAWHPDVVYCQGFHSPSLEARIVRQFPCVLFAHGYYGTCGTGEKRYRRPTLTMCSRRFGPACLALNFALGCGIRDPRRLLASYRSQARRRAHLSAYRSVLVGSRHMRNVYLQHGLPDWQVQHLPLPCTVVAPSAEPPPPGRPTGRILYAGRLTRLKGCAYLVDAIRLAAADLARPLTLVVAGSGPEEPDLRSHAAASGVPAEFHSWSDSPSLLALYRGADLLAVPSVWPEPFGLVGIEAASVGLPAVGYDVGGISDWLVPSVTGELAPGNPPSAAGLAAAIVRALRDPAHHAALRVGAWSASHAYGMPQHLAGLTAILTSAASGQGPSAGSAGNRVALTQR